MPRSEITDDGLVLADAPRVPLLVHFDEQYVWSFTPGRDGSTQDGVTTVRWPAVMRPYLSGRTRVRVATYDADVVLHDDEVAFGDGEGRVAFVDERGAAYSVDKVGHLTRSFEETSEDLRTELLDATEAVLRALTEECGVEAYLCYGALLGAVRQGTMLGHDSDVDLCYFSHHTNPTDIILESYRVQRVLRGMDWRVLRMSAGDTKVLWPLSDGRTAHIDIFSAFTIGGTFYQFGNRNGRFDVEANLLPLGTVELEGRTFPAPKRPEEMLSFIYGPNWRVPDPGFRYQDNPVGTRRLDGWFRGFRTEVPQWAPIYRAPLLDRVPREPSEFARWVEPQLRDGGAVVDLGAGTGRDAFWLAEQGHHVLAVDYSLPAVALMQRRREEIADPDSVDATTLVLNDGRRVLALGAVLARQPRDLYARGLIGSLDEQARHNLFRLARMALRQGGTLFLEFSAPTEDPEVPMPQPTGLTRRFDPGWLTGEIESHGGVVDLLEVGPGTDMFDEPDPSVARMRVVWPHR